MTNNLQIVLDILTDEVRGDVASALAKMDKSYTMTWMYKGSDGKSFPRSIPDFSAEMRDVYIIKGRKYEIVNIAEGKDVVLVELIESYPDEESGKIYRTPLVIVTEFKDGRILRGRHYCDPRLSYEFLPESDIKDALDGSVVKQVIQ